MLWSLIVRGPLILSLILSLLLPALCCRKEEYATQDGQCCPLCGPGTVVRRHCTDTSSTHCRECADGTYMNQPNGLTQCFPCSICSSADGLLVLQSCSSESDSVCGARPGFFCESVGESGGCSSAQRHSSCDPGQKVKEPGTSSTDTECEDCPEETFSPDGTNCTAWTRCSGGRDVVRAGSRTQDVLCEGASRHRYGVVLSFVVISLLPVMLVLHLKLRGRSDRREELETENVNAQAQDISSF